MQATELPDNIRICFCSCFFAAVFRLLSFIRLCFCDRKNALECWVKHISNHRWHITNVRMNGSEWNDVACHFENHMTCHISNETPFPRWERTTSCLHSTNFRYDVSKHMQKKLSIYFSFLISPLNCNRNNALNISHVRCLDMFKIQDNKSFDFSINNNFGASLTFTLILRQYS